MISTLEVTSMNSMQRYALGLLVGSCLLAATASSAYAQIQFQKNVIATNSRGLSVHGADVTGDGNPDVFSGGEEHLAWHKRLF